jgi:hypothetical protein
VGLKVPEDEAKSPDMYSSHPWECFISEALRSRVGIAGTTLRGANAGASHTPQPPRLVRSASFVAG